MTIKRFDTCYIEYKKTHIDIFLKKLDKKIIKINFLFSELLFGVSFFLYRRRKTKYLVLEERWFILIRVDLVPFINYYFGRFPILERGFMSRTGLPSTASRPLTVTVFSV